MIKKIFAILVIMGLIGNIIVGITCIKALKEINSSLNIEYQEEYYYEDGTNNEDLIENL